MSWEERNGREKTKELVMLCLAILIDQYHKSMQDLRRIPNDDVALILTKPQSATRTVGVEWKSENLHTAIV